MKITRKLLKNYFVTARPRIGIKSPLRLITKAIPGRLPLRSDEEKRRERDLHHRESSTGRNRQEHDVGGEIAMHRA